MKKTDPQINGVTITPSGKGSCYCEKKMKNSNNSPSWKTCKLRHKDSKKIFSLQKSITLFHIMVLRLNTNKAGPFAGSFS